MSVESFLQAIHADPDDDTLRLVFADWLDDHGQPERAEFIRLQIESARYTIPFERAPDFGEWTQTAQERELLAAHRLHWLGEEPNGIFVDFRRGLLHLRLYHPWLPGNLPAGLLRCLREGWVEAILVMDLSSKRVEDLVACPDLACVSALRLLGPFPSVTVAVQVAECPHFSRLTELNLTNVTDTAEQQASDELACALATTASLGNLRRLSLEGFNLGPIGIAALASSRSLPLLRELCFWDIALGYEGVEALTSNLVLDQLRHLVLGECQLDDECAQVLTTSPTLSRLTELCVATNHITEPGVHSLITSSHLSGLTVLSLPETGAHNNVASIVAENVNLPQLRYLNLSRCEINEQGATALSQSSTLASLTALRLDDNPIQDAGLAALFSQRSSLQLTHLSLANCKIRDNGVIALARLTRRSRLECLNLAENNLSDRGAEALAESSGLPALRYLSLKWCKIGPAASRALIFSSSLGQLRHLVLDRNRGPAGQSPPTERSYWQRFFSLDGPDETTDPREKITLLRATLADPDPLFRDRATEVIANLLARRGNTLSSELRQEALLALLGSLNDVEVDIRNRAIAGVGRVIEILANADDLLGAATRALGQAGRTGATEAVSLLQRLQNDSQEAVRQAARDALRDLGAADPVE